MSEAKIRKVLTHNVRYSLMAGMITSLSLVVGVLGVLSYHAYRPDSATVVMGAVPRAKVTVEDIQTDSPSGLTTVIVSVLPQPGQTLLFDASDFFWRVGNIKYAPTDSFKQLEPEVINGGGYTTKLYFLTLQEGTLIANPDKYSF